MPTIGYIGIFSRSPGIEFLEQADRALYYAKSHGRDTICYYHELVEKHQLEEIAIPENNLQFF